MKEELIYLLLTDDAFGVEIIKRFPGLYSFVTSVKQNASKEHVDKCVEKIWEFYETNDDFKASVLKHYSGQTSPRVDGKVFQLKNKDEYMRLIIKSKKENWKYTGLNVVESQDTIKVYFY